MVAQISLRYDSAAMLRWYNKILINKPVYEVYLVDSMI